MTRPAPEHPESVQRFFTGLAAATSMIRAQNELSQAEVARRARVSLQLVSDVERERANPTWLDLDKLARGLGLSGVLQLVARATESADRIAAATIRPTN